ncbi:hypothetical protein FOZG_04923 [Fusarium oxysporum Fo47]|uniref:Uncharacterized protein n=1 Tax=Fusarium oxysporum Fo47 TaxID=660027 RepID=W9KRW5_FUSOX|nr:hypothetical protein FOZG_04923 [Fusarium oxysporum Fo47]
MAAAPQQDQVRWVWTLEFGRRRATSTTLPYLTLPYYQGTLVAQAIPVKSGVWDVSDTFSTLSICCRFDRPEEIQGQGDCRVGAIHFYGTDWTGLGMTTTWSRY